MKQFLFIVLFVTAQFCYGNMASPVRKGTSSSAAFSSNNIDILKEQLNISINPDFTTAFFDITYTIFNETDGKQVPLLFHAVNYKEDFKVWVDDQEVSILQVPKDYRHSAGDAFEPFANSFSQSGDLTYVLIYWEEGVGSTYYLSDLKYFETNLSRGEHKIRVTYTASPWENRDYWVKEYSFRYSLSPAKHWKSFGTLEVNVNTAGFNRPVTTNLGEPQKGTPGSVLSWTFQKIPANYLQINYVPEVSNTAKSLIKIGPDGLTIIFGLLLAAIHLFLIAFHKRRYLKKKYSWVLIAGSIIIPFIILLFNISSYNIIDRAIGEHAGRYHGYTFLVLIFYPVFMPVYWLVMWLLSKLFPKKAIQEKD